MTGRRDSNTYGSEQDQMSGRVTAPKQIEQAQVYASLTGQAVVMLFSDRQKRQHINGIDYEFAVKTERIDQEVKVTVTLDAIRAAKKWLAEAANLGSTEEQYVEQLFSDLGKARILQAVDRHIDFQSDYRAYPNSFLAITGPEFEAMMTPAPVQDALIKEYISRRLRVAWRKGTRRIDSAQLFDRVDALYMGVRWDDLEGIIEPYNHVLWDMIGDSPLLIPTDMFKRMWVEEGDQIPQEPVSNKPFKRETSSALRGLIGRVTRTEERDFLGEAIKCYESEAYRAAIIMMWILTLDHLQEYILKRHLPDFNAELAKVTDKRVKVTAVVKSDDFGDIPEGKFIEIARAAGIISNDVRKILDVKLGIRNSFAHPSNITLPPAKAADFITDLADNVVLKYRL